MEGGRISYRLLETMRVYAMQKLEDNGERRLVTLHHAQYFLSRLENEAQGRSNPEHTFSEDWRVRMRSLLADVRAALGWALSPKGDEELGETLAVKAVFLLYELSLLDECCVWARRALDAVATTHRGSRSSRHLRLRMQLQAGLAAALVYVNGPNQETLGIWSEILASAIALGDHAFEARALWGMWNASQSSGAARNALAFAKRFALFASESGDASGAVLGYRLLGIASHYAGDQQQARVSLEQLLEHCDRLRYRMPLGQCIDQRIVGRATLARVLWLQGFRDQALRLAEAGVADACDQQPAIVKCYVLVEALVPLALLSGKRERAGQAIALLDEVSTRAGLSVSQACCRCFSEYLRSMDDVSRNACTRSVRRWTTWNRSNLVRRAPCWQASTASRSDARGSGTRALPWRCGRWSNATKRVTTGMSANSGVSMASCCSWSRQTHRLPGRSRGTPRHVSTRRWRRRWCKAAGRCNCAPRPAWASSGMRREKRRGGIAAELCLLADFRRA